MDKIGSLIAGKVGDLVEDTVKSALGIEDKDKDKDDKKKGGIFSLFGGDDKKKEDKDKKDKGGLFSFGDDKKKDEDKGGFFSRVFDRDDDDDGREKKSGFKGLFSEQEGANAAGGNEGGSEEGFGNTGQNVGVSDGDLFNDLMDVAQETSGGN